MSEIDKIASTFLGKKIECCYEYNPSLLVEVPRLENRTQYGIDNSNLPFEGVDVWHAYEFSALTENGIPVTRVMKMKYACDNDFIVESKSLKLYLNSFNMTRIGKTAAECLQISKKIIEKDLSGKLKTEVSINFLDNSIQKLSIFNKFENLTDMVDETSLTAEIFKETPELLKVKKNKRSNKHFLKFDSLRSNCRVTHQPDFGDVFIYYKSCKHIDEDSLVKYLISFRSEYHFHEECCEMIYKRLSDLLDKDDELLVCALYTRRGGIDICPVRRSKNCTVFDDVITLTDIKLLAGNGIKQ